MLAALASVVHHRQRAKSDEHNRNEDDKQGALHSDLRPRPLTTPFHRNYNSKQRPSITAGGFGFLTLSSVATPNPPRHRASRPAKWVSGVTVHSTNSERLMSALGQKQTFALQ